MSLPEVLLCQQLRHRPGGYKFRRQFPLGGITADFACVASRLVIEVDGMAHDGAEAQARDHQRDRVWRENGFSVLRIAATDILNNMEGALTLIVLRVRELGPLHHSAAPSGPPPRTGEK